MRRWRGIPIIYVQVFGLLGLTMDFMFHWLEAGNILDFMLDDFWEVENPLWHDFPLGGVWFIRFWSLGAHVMFFLAMLALILAPWLIRETRRR